MNDFVAVWRSDVWLPLLGNDGKFYLYFNGSSVWSIDYVTLTGYIVWLAAVIWLVSLSVRLLRKIFCGVVK